jgi:thioredoxin-like negative regulator of GroEL
LTANPTRGALVGGLLGLMLVTGTTTSSPRATADNGPSAATAVTTLNDLTTALAANDGKALVVFSAAWCPACKKYAPEVESAARALGTAAPFFKVDTDKAGDVAAHFDIKYLPTSLVFARGKETSRFVGSKDSNELVKLLGGSNER